MWHPNIEGDSGTCIQCVLWRPLRYTGSVYIYKVVVYVCDSLSSFCFVLPLLYSTLNFVCLHAGAQALIYDGGGGGFAAVCGYI